VWLRGNHGLGFLDDRGQLDALASGEIEVKNLLVLVLDELHSRHGIL
jgi:hypothetical protein